MTLTTTDNPTRASTTSGSLEIALTDLAGSETQWRAFEHQALITPYQRFEWVRAFADTMEPNTEVAVATVRSRGRIVAMLGMTRRRTAGLRVARPVGGKHANFNQPLIDRDFLASASARDMRALFVAVGRVLHADLVLMPSSPVSWSGTSNPLAPSSTATASNAYGLTLGPDPVAVLNRVSSSHTRKKLRNKERGLAKEGAFVVKRATSPSEVTAVLEAFFDHKRRRFQTLGIGDPYANQDAQAFARTGGLRGLDENVTAIELYGLFLEDRIIAVLGGAADAQRFSGMFISFEADAPEARFSPGEILVAHTIAAQCRLGRSFFDLGVGEARYKRAFCDETIELVDIVVPVTLPGRMGCIAVRAALAAKRRLKQSPFFMQALARARRFGAGARTG